MSWFICTVIYFPKLLCFRWAPMRLWCQRLLFPAGPALPFWIQELLGGNFTLRSRWLEVHECVISPGDLGSVVSWLFSVVIHRVGRDWLDNQGFGLVQFSSALVWYKDHLRKRPWELLESRPNSDKEAMPVAHRSVVPGPVTTPSGNLRKIQILGPLSRPNELKTLGVGPAIHVLKSHSSDSDSCSNLKTIGLRASHPWLHTWGICLKYRIWSGAQKNPFLIPAWYCCSGRIENHKCILSLRTSFSGLYRVFVMGFPIHCLDYRL